MLLFPFSLFAQSENKNAITYYSGFELPVDREYLNYHSFHPMVEFLQILIPIKLPFDKCLKREHFAFNCGSVVKKPFRFFHNN
ncbi:MAG: hypothetical protein CVU11_00895 [Bacteroidetes bacterium HGW-Bacteroidetes-6]|jgi:hypothetical protein|nr:MAG: hypothetical protein CVU11_00895 [Bacteroidetes bacterium HGW-Bacteroidetes-6]